MAEQPLGIISEPFGQLEDPRIERNKLHPLLNIIVIAICAVICVRGGELGRCGAVREPEEGMAGEIPGSD